MPGYQKRIMPEIPVGGNDMEEGLDRLKEKRRRRLSQKKFRKRDEYRRNEKGRVIVRSTAVYDRERDDRE
jgi:hypothetical protein